MFLPRRVLRTQGAGSTLLRELSLCFWKAGLPPLAPKRRDGLEAVTGGLGLATGPGDREPGALRQHRGPDCVGSEGSRRQSGAGPSESRP